MAVAALERFRLIVYDFLRYHPLFRSLVAQSILIRESKAISRPSTELARTINRLGLAARITASEKTRRRIESVTTKLSAHLKKEELDWDALIGGTAKSEVRKGIILKPPVSDAERGVLLIAFETHWMRLLRHADLQKLAAKYHLIVAPTWSPPHDLAIMLVGYLWPGPLFHLLSNFNDQPVFGRLIKDSWAVPLLSSSWVNPVLFSDSAPVEKEFDIVMLANFSTYKRHFSFFCMLRNMPPATKVLLLGRPLHRRDAETIMHEASLAGVADRITIKQGLPDDELVKAMRSAKIHVIYSKNEGSCVAVAESMFADVPVALLEDANIGSGAWINDQTGCFLSTRNPAKDLTRAIDRYESFQPRDWVTSQSIDYVGSTRVLNDSLKAFAKERGEPWTRDIVTHTWRPNPSYVRTEDVDELAPLAERFRDDYGVALLVNRIDQ